MILCPIKDSKIVSSLEHKLNVVYFGIPEAISTYVLDLAYH